MDTTVVLERNYRVLGDLSKPLQGTVTYIHTKEGWGFIRDHDTFRDQVHFLEIACENFDAVHVGDVVRYEVADPPDTNGPHAKRVWTEEEV